VPVDAMMNGHGSAMLVTAVTAELVYQLVGANMSSPQTAELNAEARAPTIQKWVNLTNAEAAGWIVLLMVLSRGLWGYVLLGGLIAGVGMWAKYRYAINSGLRDKQAPTESY
jgi:hypothetical protein